MHKVGSLKQLKDDEVLAADIDGPPVAVFLVEGRPVATYNQCPHAEGPLAEGLVCDKILTCPWHGWTFHLETGFCEEDPDLVLPFLEAIIENDDVFVKL